MCISALYISKAADPKKTQPNLPYSLTFDFGAADYKPNLGFNWIVVTQHTDQDVYILSF